MTTGTLKTQGTKLYFANSPSEILQVLCATGASGFGGAADQIDITCLDSNEREFVGGLINPNAVSIPINFIYDSDAHQALIEQKELQEVISWMVVFSNQTAAPTTLDTDDRLISPGPTTVEFLGYVADLDLDVSTNEIVRATLSVQRSGELVWDHAATTQ